MYSALSLRLVAHRGIQRSTNVFIIIIFSLPLHLYLSSPSPLPLSLAFFLSIFLSVYLCLYHSPSLPPPLSLYFTAMLAGREGLFKNTSVQPTLVLTHGKTKRGGRGGRGNIDGAEDGHHLTDWRQVCHASCSVWSVSVQVGNRHGVDCGTPVRDLRKKCSTSIHSRRQRVVTLFKLETWTLL